MSARSTLPRPVGSSQENTQQMDLSGLEAEEHQTVVVPGAEPTLVQPAEPVELDAEAARERRRAQRDEALGTRRKTADVEPVEEVAEPPRAKRTTDKFVGSLGLFLLRIVTAGIIGLHGFAKALDIAGVQQMLADTLIPEPMIMAYVLAASEVAIALALLFGLLTRLAGLGLAAIGIGALVFVRWVGNPFEGNTLTGEVELLLGGIGLLFLCLGAGGWSIDRAVRRNRETTV